MSVSIHELIPEEKSKVAKTPTIPVSLGSDNIKGLVDWSGDNMQRRQLRRVPSGKGSESRASRTCRDLK